MEKYHWTPQEIQEIPQIKMDEMMIVLNQRIETEAEVKMRSDLDEKASNLLGKGGSYKKHL